jgi:hypothetical protein
VEIKPSHVLVIISSTIPTETVDFRLFSIFCANCLFESIVITPGQAETDTVYIKRATRMCTQVSRKPKRIIAKIL